MKRERGVALTEFALTLPMLLMIMLPILEFGRAYYQYNTIAKSVRQAARYLSVRSPGIDTDKARNIVVYGNPAGSGTPLVPGLSLSNVPAPTYCTTGSYPVLNTVTGFENADDFRNLVVGRGPEGYLVKLSDVADVG